MKANGIGENPAKWETEGHSKGSRYEARAPGWEVTGGINFTRGRSILSSGGKCECEFVNAVFLRVRLFEMRYAKDGDGCERD